MGWAGNGFVLWEGSDSKDERSEIEREGERWGKGGEGRGEGETDRQTDRQTQTGRQR